MNTNPNPMHEYLAHVAVGYLTKSTVQMYNDATHRNPATNWEQINEELIAWESKDGCTTDYLHEHRSFRLMPRDRVEVYAKGAMKMIAQMTLARALEIARTA